VSTKRSKIKRQLKQISRNMARLYREEVIRQNLIDTGLMRDSFEVGITVSKFGELDIQVMAVPYYPFIDNSPHHFKVSENVFKSKAYKRLEDKLIGVISLEYALKFPKSFDSSEAVEYFYTYPTNEKGTEKFYKGGQFMPNGRRAPKGGIIAGRLSVVSKHF
tara:strand:+ start:1890 stop:2375 length:486 start_codon:yes stop_codon:yes gene_type:complete